MGGHIRLMAGEAVQGGLDLGLALAVAGELCGEGRNAASDSGCRMVPP
ncbi:hypothetical protein ACFPOI_31190 [Nonomuraea angiospora]|uniref:Uncharacterized protein n=1 Tax=Nonomuraea angiospora TaxID=46172 RepID=A0ABR9M3K6_9ACTN|nr:hypothetical protein [Nonomuraea angiospora]MBE1587480.1 hypothetical protein [Nonomuraea angiospora]